MSAPRRISSCHIGPTSSRRASAAADATWQRPALAPLSWQITPKRGVVLLSWPIFVCATVGLKKTLCDTTLARKMQPFNKIDDWQLFVSPLTVDSTLVRHTLRHKLYRFDLSQIYLLQGSLYNVETTNRPSGVWALLFSLLTTDARCLVIKLGGQCVMVDFALTSVAWSIGVSRHTCFRWLTS